MSSYDDNDDLRRAMDALTIFDVWSRAFADGAVVEPCPAQRRDGQFPSPFREDGKRGSFSVCHDGRGFKDFGGDGAKGGVWRFHQLCWPNAQPGERAKQLIDWSGITPTPRSRPTPADPADPAAPGQAPAVDPRLAKAAKALEKRDRNRELEDRVYQARDEQLRPPEAKPLVPWPSFVEQHWTEGLEMLAGDPAAVKRLADSRGWPVEWAHALVDLGLMAYPWERWARPGEKWAKRQKAFLVQGPRMKSDGSTVLVDVGYHQRGFMPAANGQPERKLWLFVPSLPKDKQTGRLGSPRSELERMTIDDARDRGVDVDRMPALVPPLPFVLGDLQAPRLVVLLEGQWDAITFFGALGLFHDTATPDGIAVFGIRGVQGMDAFLAHWLHWLRRHRPRVWVIADNDAAGGSWRDAPKAEPGLPRPPGLGERLKHAGARQPVISWLRPGPRGKDFNDYFRHERPSVAAMWRWLDREGLHPAKNPA